jgi:hypothetical protein
VRVCNEYRRDRREDGRSRPTITIAVRVGFETGGRQGVNAESDGGVVAVAEICWMYVRYVQYV